MSARFPRLRFRPVGRPRHRRAARLAVTPGIFVIATTVGLLGLLGLAAALAPAASA